MFEKDFGNFLEQVDLATRKNFKKFSEFITSLSYNEKNGFMKNVADYKNKNNPDLNLLEVGHDLIKAVYLDPYHIKTKGKYLWTLVTFIRIFMIVHVFIDIAIHYGNVIYLVNCAKSVSAFLQGISKTIPFILYFEQIIYILLATISRFWEKPLDKTEANNYNLWRKLMLTYKYVAYVLIVMMIITALLYDELLFPVYIPDYPLSLQIFQIFQFFEFIMDLLVVVGMDLTFLACCVIIWRQTTILSNEFILVDGKSGYKSTMKQFKRCVVHHDFLLDYVKVVISTFTLPLLIQYLASVLGMCIEMYLLTENPTIVEVINSIVYFSLLSSQIGLYCFMADKTCEMVDNIPNFLYKTEWYNNPHYLNKLYVMVLCRSQKEIKFTGGGMIKINKEGFAAVFKTTLSFYTLARQMKDRE